MIKKSLLWVDDEVELLQPHVLFLEKKGYKLDTCHNGIDAISHVKENDYDLVLLDENMPGMSGIEVLEIIKERTENFTNRGIIFENTTFEDFYKKRCNLYKKYPL